MSGIPEKLGSIFYRDLLSPQGRTVYDCIVAQLLVDDYSGSTSFPLFDFSFSVSDCSAAYIAVRDDHPEYFFLGEIHEFIRYRNTGTLNYSILYNRETIAQRQRQLRRLIYRIVRGTAPFNTVGRETLVYERIARRLSYINHKNADDHNIVGPLAFSSGVCEGHNALLLLCFRRLSIPCIKVYGRTESGSRHCWTIAWIDGNPVHCDVTWDLAKDGLVWFDYLNLSDRQISEDHFDFMANHIPACSTGTFSYYRYHGLCIDSFSCLRALLRSTFAKGISPVLMHLCYTPTSGNCQDEVRRALEKEHFSGSYRYRYLPKRNKIALTHIED